MFKGPLHLVQAIDERKRKGLFRALNSDVPDIDLCSNDYLGFSAQGLVEKKMAELNLHSKHSGSTGSRLISGNTVFAEELEKDIAQFHNAESALIFNSGYGANLGLLSVIPQKGDLILFDELSHASLYDGIRLSHAKHYKFRHNDTHHLNELIHRHKKDHANIYVVVESVYSMDGDEAPLKELAAISEKNKCHLVVDEAHAIGVFGKQGRGLCNEAGIEDKCFARVYTFGKAMGCHGAAVAGSRELKDYLINFSRSFIYTTALPFHSLASVKAAYRLLRETKQTEHLQNNISEFQNLARSKNFIKSRSAIHCLIVNGNENVNSLEKKLAVKNIFVKGIKSPTVKEGQERLRICLHAFNTHEQLQLLAGLLA